MTEQQFSNPISQSFRVLDGYRSLLKEALTLSTIGPTDQETIMARCEVDRGLSFSLNPTYRRSERSFRRFCEAFQLSASLPDRFPAIIDNNLYVHQEHAISAILRGETTVIATGTGSGKTETFLIPLINAALTNRQQGMKAIIVYPMNALAGDQVRRLRSALAGTPITFGLYVGSTPQYSESKDLDQDSNELLSREAMHRHPPDILLTNFVMLDRLLVGSVSRGMFIASSETMQYLVVDEMHAYRGSKAAHLCRLLTRVRDTFPQPIVQIGASATLARQARAEGYLAEDQDDPNLRHFVTTLFDVPSYAYIEAEIEAPPTAETRPIPSTVGQTTGWKLTEDFDSNVAMLEALTGTLIPPAGFTGGNPLETPVGQALLHNVFIQDLLRAMSQRALQFTEIVDLLIPYLPSDPPIDHPEEIAKAYLSAIAYMNHLIGRNHQERPLMDFRIHLFVRQIQGYLKQCLACRQYHPGDQMQCPECGFPLFAVYRHDIRKCVAKLSGRQPRATLARESDDPASAAYVLLSLQDEDRKEADLSASAFLFHADRAQAMGELDMRYDADGRWAMEYLGSVTELQDTLDGELISLFSANHDYEYLHQLIIRMLAEQRHQDRKLLGFIDHRSNASRLAQILRDEFGCDYFEWLLSQVLEESSDWSLERIYQELQRAAEDRLIEQPSLQLLVQELDLWFARQCKVPERKLAQIQFVMKLRENQLQEVEKAVLNIFLKERAILWPTISDERVKSAYFFKYQRYVMTTQLGIYFAGNKSTLSNYPGIALTEDPNSIYREIVEQYGPDVLLQTLYELQQRRIVVERALPPDEIGSSNTVKHQWYLLPDAVTMASSSISSARQSSMPLLLAEGHTSEVETKRRRELEAMFQEGAINFLLATTTLEMGIDIGQLSQVLLVSVPPLPSNYAQRAGRAGRGSDRFALITTFCMNWNQHDMYYFQQPQRMINGVITPPAFDANNEAIFQQHLNAVLLAGVKNPLEWLEAQLTNYNINEAHIEQLFGIPFNLREYLVQVLQPQLRKLDDPTINNCYKTRILPNYAFRQDEINVFSQDDTPRQQADEEPEPVAHRDPEQAIKDLVPGRTLHAGSDIFKILPDGHYQSSLIKDQHEMRWYEDFRAQQEWKFVRKAPEIQRYDLAITFASERYPAAIPAEPDVVWWVFDPSTDIMFENHGTKKGKEISPFDDERTGTTFEFGYRLPRQAMILTFNQLICDETTKFSLIGALDRAIKKRYGLDESEIGVIWNVLPRTPLGSVRSMLPEDHLSHVLFYETEGNSSLPFSRIADEMLLILQDAYTTVKSCSCQGNRGCYLCLKSYVTQRLGMFLDKTAALMILGYLLGMHPYQPTIAPYREIASEEIRITIALSGETVIVSGNGFRIQELLQPSHNAAIFRALLLFLKALPHDRSPSLCFVTKLDYIGKAIEEGSIGKDATSLARLRFEFLRFAQIKVVRG